MKSFPRIKDLSPTFPGTTVSTENPAFAPRSGVEWKISQLDVTACRSFESASNAFSARRVPCPSRTRQEGAVRWPRFFVRIAGLEMHPSTPTTAPAFKISSASSLQHHKCVPRSVPRRFASRQRHHPSQRARGGRFYDPLTMFFRKIRAGSTAFCCAAQAR